VVQNCLNIIDATTILPPILRVASTTITVTTTATAEWFGIEVNPTHLGFVIELYSSLSGH